MSLQEFAEIMRSLWVVWLMLLFLGIVAWVIWPKNKDRLERQGRIPLDNEK